MVYLIIGRRKRGKTTLGRYMVNQSPRRAVFDPRKVIPVGPEGVRVTTALALHDVAFPALEAGEVTEVLYTPDSDDLAGPLNTFACELKRWTVEHPSAPLGVLIDELGWIEAARRDPPALRRALRNCEPEIFDVFITCHRPTDVPVNTRAIADSWIVFHCVQEHDLDVIRERCNEQVAQLVAQLDGRAFIVYDDALGTVTRYREQPGVVSAWYVPLLSSAERARVEPLTAIDGATVEPVKIHVDRKLPLE